jgi:hypothetical protein
LIFIFKHGAGLLVFVEVNWNIPVTTARASTGEDQLRIETVCVELLVMVTRTAAEPKVEEAMGGAESVTSIGIEDENSDMIPNGTNVEFRRSNLIEKRKIASAVAAKKQQTIATR